MLQWLLSYSLAFVRVLYKILRTKDKIIDAKLQKESYTRFDQRIRFGLDENKQSNFRRTKGVVNQKIIDGGKISVLYKYSIFEHDNWYVGSSYDVVAIYWRKGNITKHWWGGCNTDKSNTILLKKYNQNFLSKLWK